MASPDSHSYYQLKLLESIEGRPELPRRKAASKLGVSVKLAHKLLTGLVERGLVHVRKENARRWRYFLTPQGVAEKARLTREFVEFSLEFFRSARRRSAQVCRELSEQGVRRVAFLGLGELAEITLLGVQEWGLELIDVYDDARAGSEFFGCTTRPTADVADCAAERIIVTSVHPRHPLTPGFLPHGVAAEQRMVWIFGQPQAGAAAADSQKGTDPDAGTDS